MLISLKLEVHASSTYIFQDIKTSLVKFAKIESAFTVTT